MCWQRLTLGLLVGVVLSGGVSLSEGGDKKQNKKTGTVEGVLTEKKLDRPWWVLVMADGEEKARRYWGYGAFPSDDMKKQLAACPVGSRVRLTWEVVDANEGPHVAKLELVKAPDKKKAKP